MRMKETESCPFLVAHPIPRTQSEPSSSDCRVLPLLLTGHYYYYYHSEYLLPSLISRALVYSARFERLVCYCWRSIGLVRGIGQRCHQVRYFSVLEEMRGYLLC
jgi:hypothetical protein